MLGILAHSFMTATRVNEAEITDFHAAKTARKRRWTAPEYWRMKPSRSVNLDDL